MFMVSFQLIKQEDNPIRACYKVYIYFSDNIDFSNHN